MKFFNSKLLEKQGYVKIGEPTDRCFAFPTHRRIAKENNVSLDSVTCFRIEKMQWQAYITPTKKPFEELDLTLP